MLGILILIGIGSLFNRFAKKHGLSQVLWVILSIVSYYAAQVIAGVFIGLFAPDMLYETGGLMLVGLLSGFAGVGITFLIMKRVAESKNQTKTIENEDILDSELID